MSSDSLITVSNISKLYGGTAVVDGVSFDVKKGDILAIIGPNGAGKSTLLRMIMGLLTPSSGSVSIEGMSPKKARTRMGYVPQRFSFDPWLPMTVQEFLALSAHISGVHESEKEQIIRDRLQRVGVPGVAHQTLNSLSGGQLQRVMIARSILTQKDILLLDEPVAGIDVEGQQAMYDLIRDINTEYGTTCLLISHELDVVFEYANSVVCINKNMICHGVPHVALSKETLEAMYGKHTAYYHHGLEHSEHHHHHEEQHPSTDDQDKKKKGTKKKK